MRCRSPELLAVRTLRFLRWAFCRVRTAGARFSRQLTGIQAHSNRVMPGIGSG